jgi:hypothetical protein
MGRGTARNDAARNDVARGWVEITGGYDEVHSATSWRGGKKRENKIVRNQGINAVKDWLGT